MLENLPYFQRHLPDDLAKVNAVINQAVQSDVALISQIGTYIISAGGKRLRPIITILAGKAVGHDDEKLYSLAAMVEFIHTSTLLHDDVVDESERPQVHSAGVELAPLDGTLRQRQEGVGEQRGGVETHRRESEQTGETQPAEAAVLPDQAWQEQRRECQGSDDCGE